MIGIIIAFMGSILLFLNSHGHGENNNLIYVSYIIAATIFYGINVNLVFRHLQEIPSIRIAGVALFMNAIPAGIVLIISGFFSLDFASKTILASTFYSIILGIFGTAVASIIFYMLIKRAGAVFSSMVTYGIPIVAIFWGIIYGEYIGWPHIISLVLILIGVYIANMKTSLGSIRVRSAFF